jgi:tetratricopeptide (TPR) repeat protein
MKTLKSNHIVSAIISFLIMGSLGAVDRTDYDGALENYKTGNYPEALSRFSRFAEEYPGSAKADDALWYMGRIYAKTDQPQKAREMFRSVLATENSNRFDEASYDLASLLYGQSRYGEVRELLNYTAEVNGPDSYQLKSLELLAKSLDHLAFREKAAYKNDAAGEEYGKALAVYGKLERDLADAEDLARIRYAMAKIYLDLSDLAFGGSLYGEYRQKARQNLEEALPDLSDFYRPRGERALEDLNSSEKVNVSGNLTAYAGANNHAEGSAGSDITVKGTLDFPLRNRSSLSLSAGYRHDSFHFVASNFDAAKTGDSKLVEYTDTVGADLAWQTGTRRNAYNKLDFFTDFQFAEDNRDNYIKAGASDIGTCRFLPDWRAGWNSKIEYRTYPDYLVAGRKLDFLKGSLSPEIKFYAPAGLDVSLAYGIDYKQYLNSRYDTSDPLIPSAQNKAYLYNRGKLTLDFNGGGIYNPVLSYGVTYQKSFAYDYLVSGLPADRFIEDYYDNMSHTISLDQKIQLGDRIRTVLKSDIIFTNFPNYPARDESNTFIDELRSDMTVKLDGEVGYLLPPTSRGIEYEILLSAWWKRKTSNMTYNTTFTTNYTDMGVMLGASVNLP